MWIRTECAPAPRPRVALSGGCERWADAEDALLVRASTGGDTAAFEELVRRHEPRIYHFVARYVETHEDALDLTQEVFLKTYHYLGSFRGEASFQRWLRQIAM